MTNHNNCHSFFIQSLLSVKHKVVTDLFHTFIFKLIIEQIRRNSVLYQRRISINISKKTNLQITEYSQNFKLNATFLFAFPRKKQKEQLLKVFYD